MLPNSEVDTVTLGEVNRNLIKLTEQVTALAASHNSRPEWADIKRVEAGLDQRILSLESWVKWAGRTIIAALITAAVGLLLKLG